MAKKKKKDVYDDGRKVLARNKRILRDYDVSDRFEAGIVLVGSEVKSLRDARCSLVDGYVEFKSGEAWLNGIKINEYPWANRWNHEEGRSSKLLLHTKEIHKLEVKVNQRGFTVVPLSIYLRNGKVKIELAVARGRREYEKRHAKKEAMVARETQQELRRRR